MRMRSRFARRMMRHARLKPAPLSEDSFLGIPCEKSPNVGLFKYLSRKWGSEIFLRPGEDISGLFSVDEALTPGEELKSIVDTHGLVVFYGGKVSKEIESFAHGTQAFCATAGCDQPLDDKPLHFHRDTLAYSMISKESGTLRDNPTYFSSKVPVGRDNIIGKMDEVRDSIENLDPELKYALNWQDLNPKVGIWSNQIGFSHGSAGERGPVKTYFMNP